MAGLILRLMGPPCLEVDGKAIDLGRRKAVALAAYLAATGQGHSRDALATLLWPEYDQSHARAALRRTLSVLKKALGGEWLDIGRDTIGLRQDTNLYVDVDEFRTKLAECREQLNGANERCTDCLPLLTEAVALYRDYFLAGFSLRDSANFDDWQFFEAETLRRDLAWALERLVHDHISSSEYELAIDHARRWLGLDPMHEDARRHLMRLYAWTGQRAAALRQYQECVRVLEAELGVTPSRETIDLYEEIRSGTLATPAEEREPIDEGEDRIHVPAPPSINAIDPVEGSPLDIVAELEPTETEPHVFVARDDELAQLTGCLNRALAGQGQVALVTGGAGAGKTALVHEFARRAQGSIGDLVVATGSCDAHTGLGNPYLPFRRILGLLLGDVEAKWADETITRENAGRLRALLPVSVRTILDDGPDLLDRFVASAALAERAATLMPEARELLERLDGLTSGRTASAGAGQLDMQNALLEQFTDVLLELAKSKPLLLVVDDGQWMDVASIGLLFHLTKRLGGSRILIVIVYRPHDLALGRDEERHPLEPVVNELKRTFGDIQVDLDQPMGRDFVDALVDAQPNRFGPDFRDALFRQTQGHPLFTLELLRDMQERGAVVCDERGCLLEGPVIDWKALPARVEALMQEHTGRLDERLRDILKVASVEGRLFTAQVVAGVQRAGERDLLHDLSQQLEKHHNVIRELGEEQVGSRYLLHYQFTHTLFQQYTYGTLSAGERRLLHGEVAAVLEEIYEGQLEEITVQLARHYCEAGQMEKAVTYLCQAGDRARGLYAHQEAIGFYEQALDLLKAQGANARAARTLMKLGLTYHLAFDFQRARQAYREGFALWHRSGPDQATQLAPAPHALRLIGDDPITLDPTMADDNASGLIISQLFSGLVTLNPEMDAVPDVAGSWEVLDGGSKYIFHLRDDVRWTDGVPVTAQDFVYAWRRVLEPGTGSPHASYLYDVKGARGFHQREVSDPAGVGVGAPDDSTLVVELEGPTSYFPQLLHSAYPIPRHVVERYGENWTAVEKIVTNGPFKLERFESRKLAVLVHNPDYLGQRSGNVERIEISLGRDSWAGAIQIYEADDLDVLWLWSPPEADLLRQRHAEEYFSAPSLNTQYIGFNVRVPPFDDLRVRRAFAMALDKETLASVIRRGCDFPANGGLVPPGMPGHSPDVGLPHDPEQARRLMAEAGYPMGHGFPSVIAPILSDWGDVCEYLGEQWRDHLGIEVNWQPTQWAELFEQMDKDPPLLFRMAWMADYPDPDNILRRGVRERWTGWRNQTYVQLVDEARRITNQQQRMELYQRADRILMEEAAIVPILYGRRHLLIKPWVSKYPTSAIIWADWKDVIINAH